MPDAMGSARRLLSGLAISLSISAAGFDTRGGVGRVRPDANVEVSVRSLTDGTLLAERVECRAASVKDQLTGSAQAVDLDGGTLMLLGTVVRVQSNTDIFRELGRPYERVGRVVYARWSDLQPGIGVRVFVTRNSDGEIVAGSVHILDVEPGRRGRVLGSVGLVERLSRHSARVRVSGLDLVVDDGTEFSGCGRAPQYIVRPRLGVVDDDDLQFRNGSRVGRHFDLAGEIRFRANAARGSELEAASADRGDDISTGTLAILGLAAEFGPVFAYLDVAGERDYDVIDSNELVNAGGQARVREAYVEIFGLRHVAFAIGRQQFKETRRWYYDRSELDAARLLLDFRPVFLEASISQDAFDDTTVWRNVLGRASFRLARRHVLELYFLDREDRTSGVDSPRFYGLRLLGNVGRRVDYWADLTSQRGTRPASTRGDGNETVESREIRGRAWDVGITIRPRVVGDPSLSLAYAFGSGDETGCCASTSDTPDRRFTQTGLHRNRGRFNGLGSFRYYGEALDPELSNLHVATVGVGIRPVRSVSLDCIYHVYRQDAPDTTLYGANLDADPMGSEVDVGTEWDLVLVYEPRRWLEMKLTGGRFLPGSAFIDPDAPVDGQQETFDVVRFDTRFRF